MEGRELPSRWCQNEAKGRKGPMKAILIHNLVYVLIMAAHRHQPVNPWQTPATYIFILNRELSPFSLCSHSLPSIILAFVNNADPKAFHVNSVTPLTLFSL